MKTKLKKTRWFTVLITVIMVLAVSCEGPEGSEGPAGPTGPKGDKGDIGAMGNANVKYTEWIDFNTQINWQQYRPDFALFKHNNDKFNFTTQTIKDIAAGKYVSLCYIKTTTRNYIWTLPAFLASNDFTEFGYGSKMVNYAIGVPSDGSYFQCEINITSTDGTEVTGAQGNWSYRLIFISVDGGQMKSQGNTKTLQQELEQLSYEEVCKRYNVNANKK